MPSKLEQLETMTTVVCDSGDFAKLKEMKVTDATTNPSLILKAAKIASYDHLIEEAVTWGASHKAVTSQITDRLAVNFGAEITKMVPGRVSTEVDADLSFDTEATIEKAYAIIADYAARGIDKSRILIKVAGTWEGIRAVEHLQKEGIDCNVTLIFCLAQAIAAADAGAFLISPFVGRIMDWYKAAEGKTYTSETDPGVLSVREIYAYYKAYGISTVVMGASFRNIGEIEALAGCDRLTISPELLKELAEAPGRPAPHARPEDGREQGAGEDRDGREDVPPPGQHGRHGDSEARRGHSPVRQGSSDPTRAGLDPSSKGRLRSTNPHRLGLGSDRPIVHASRFRPSDPCGRCRARPCSGAAHAPASGGRSPADSRCSRPRRAPRSRSSRRYRPPRGC